ncbi:reverse transcriptase [Lasius niger]|uniref:Reverse transcriptase n=1 Tax=Lasius niger TaxID=67767 RepID=A0A0J7KJC5_LASNI|nr:reverse transcriptase [Lasius niger]
MSVIVPNLSEWIAREHGGLNYYLTQFLTAHGSFGYFLHKIKKRETPSCFHCNADVDTVDHTLRQCPTWEKDRTQMRINLRLAEDENLTLETVVKRILQDCVHWYAFSQFAAKVIKEKEDEERR